MQLQQPWILSTGRQSLQQGENMWTHGYGRLCIAVKIAILLLFAAGSAARPTSGELSILQHSNPEDFDTSEASHVNASGAYSYSGLGRILLHGCHWRW